jgi:hypothetical protein
VPFEIDHLIARKHGGKTIAGNLAVSCIYCNAHKGPNISGIDPKTGKLTRLYHPRRHKWSAALQLKRLREQALTCAAVSGIRRHLSRFQR